MLVSIFNDVIGPVMRGPSSSHCAAALRIGRLALNLMDNTINHVQVDYDVHGSLPTTHDSQGSDMGLFGGLMGWNATDARLPDSMQILQNTGVTIDIRTVDVRDEHPNTYRLMLTNDQGTRFLRAISTGGGMIEVIQIDGFNVTLYGDAYTTLVYTSHEHLEDVLSAVSLAQADSITVVDGDSDSVLVMITGSAFVPESILNGPLTQGVSAIKYLKPVLPVLTTKTTTVPFTTAAELVTVWGDTGSLADAAIAYECARSGLSKEAVVEQMVDIVRILRSSIASGLAGTDYADRVLGFQSGGFARMLEQGRLLDAGTLNTIILYVTAMMEVKSSMGVIVAMPTAGACAALPGSVIAMAEAMHLGETEMATALLASGLIGVFITTAWSFAAEVGGCQAEGGSAAAMAAAALVTMAGGTVAQSLAAASMALQSMLGLICDPIANRVEAPCLGKNVMAAANALSCANMSLAGFDQVIPFDEVIETAKRVSAQMPRELRCTALGGLSITPTSKAIELRLATVRSGCGACGSGGCG